MDLAKTKLPLQVKYVAAVLHLHGYSVSETAALLKRYRLMDATKGKVSGLFTRIGLKTGGGREARQAMLDQLAADRYDGGLLEPHVFRAI